MVIAFIAVNQLCSQTYVAAHHSSSHKEISLYNIPKSNYYSSSHRWTFEYGLLVNATDVIKDRKHQKIAHVLSADYNFNLSVKKLFGSIQPGIYYAPGEDGGLSLSLGLNYVFYEKNRFNLSACLGTEGIFGGEMLGLMGVAHIRSTYVFNNKWAFTAGLRYMLGIGTNEHWIMPTIGYQYFLK